MTIVSSYVDFVNSQAKRLERIIAKHPEDKRAKTAYQPFIQKFEAIAEHLNRQDELNQSLQHRVAELEGELAKRQLSLDNLDLKPHDLAGLPPEVIQQLSIGDVDLQEFKFLEMIEAAGGTMTLDKLIIQLYRETSEVHDRAKLNARLYRMTSKGMLYSVPGKRGVYSIYKPTEASQDSYAPTPEEGDA